MSKRHSSTVSSIVGSSVSLGGGRNSSVVMGSRDGKITVSSNGKTVVMDRAFKSLSQIDGDMYIDGVKLDLVRYPPDLVRYPPDLGISSKESSDITDEPQDSKQALKIEINIQGDPENVEGDTIFVTGDIKGNARTSTGNITAGGVVGSVATTTGDVTVKGDAEEITTSTGNVHISGSVKGSVRTSTGNIYHKNDTNEF